jgi:hypothetical protein
MNMRIAGNGVYRRSTEQIKNLIYDTVVGRSQQSILVERNEDKRSLSEARTHLNEGESNWYVLSDALIS